MFRHLALAVVLTAQLLEVEGARAANGPKVPPGTWAVEYAQEYCVLSREGVAGEPGVAFRTRPLALEHDFLIYVPRTGATVPSGDGQVLVSDNDTPTARWTWIEEPQGKRFRLIHTLVDSEQLARALSAGSVRMRVPGSLDMRISLLNVRKAAEALRVCEDDLARRWGVEPAEMRSWSRPAASRSDLRSLFWNSKDNSAVAMIQSGATRAVLDIDEMGQIAGCKIVQHSRVAWVDAQFCETIRKGATFDPALDAHGKAVKGKVVTPAISSVRLR